MQSRPLGDGGSRVNKTDGFYLEKMDAVGGRGRGGPQGVTTGPLVPSGWKGVKTEATHTHPKIHTQTHAYTHVHMHVCTHTRVHTQTHIDTQTHIHVHTHTHARTQTHMYTELHTCITYTHRHTHTHTHTGGLCPALAGGEALEAPAVSPRQGTGAGRVCVWELGTWQILQKVRAEPPMS